MNIDVQSNDEIIHCEPGTEYVFDVKNRKIYNNDIELPNIKFYCGLSGEYYEWENISSIWLVVY